MAWHNKNSETSSGRSSKPSPLREDCATTGTDREAHGHKGTFSQSEGHYIFIY
jgi:hypothetical protein